MSRTGNGDTSDQGDRLTDEERRAWREAARPRTYTHGRMVLRQGEPGRSVLLIDRGLAKVFATSPDGRDVVLAIRGPGETLGEVAVLDGGQRSAGVAALGELRVWALGRDAFLDFLARFPRVSVALLSTLSDRLREADAWRLAYGTRSATDRLVARLLTLADLYGQQHPDGAGVRLNLPLTQSDLAGSIGASRESVVKALRRLRDVDAVTVDATGHVVLTDPALLRTMGLGVIRDT